MPTRRAVLFIPASRDQQAETEATPIAPELNVVAVVRGGIVDGGGVADALVAIARGDAQVLLAARLSDIAGSARELVGLLDWLEQAGAALVALDVGLDTGQPSGRRTVAALREVEGWQRAPGPGRQPPGRPGVRALAPELGSRIAAMRERGLSLRAIADALNADGVATPRGGAQWRASSVQAALGYRRPRPPVPGAPPPRATGDKDLPHPHPPGPRRRERPRPPRRADGAR